MALKLNKVTTTKSGFILPINNVITSRLHSLFVEVSDDGDGGVDFTRRLTYDLRNYISDAEVILVGENYVKGGIQELPPSYKKTLTDAEYTALLADGSLAEVWLKDWVDSIMGADTATIYDPYV